MLACLEAPEPAESRYPTVVDVIDASRDLSHAVSYDELVTRQLSQACAAYVDRAQASWPLSREGGFYAGFRRLLAEDASPRLLVGRAGLAAASRALPTEPRALLRHALEVLGVTPSEREDYLTALLLSILGWASAFAFTRWEARLTGGDDEDIVHLLAARLTWELLLYQEVASADVRQTVRRARASFRSRPLAARTAGEAEWVLQRAVEVAYQQRLVPDVEAETASAPDEAPPGLASTGDSSFNRLWTLLGVPCVSVPGAVGDHGAPVGLQLVAPHGADAQVQLTRAVMDDISVQKLGYAEADPTFDVAGIDSAHKLTIMVSLAYGTPVNFKEIYTEGITGLTPLDIAYAKEFGFTIKLLAIAKFSDGEIEARVHPTMVPSASQIAKVDGVYNAIQLVGDAVEDVVLYGRGAGSMPTGSAVVSDVMSIARDMLKNATGRVPPSSYQPDQRRPLRMRPMEEITSLYYIRFMVLDRPGVLSQIAGVLGRYGISISSVLQQGRKEGQTVPVVIMTHMAKERDIQNALREINPMPYISEPTTLIRVEGRDE